MRRIRRATHGEDQGGQASLVLLVMGAALLAGGAVLFHLGMAAGLSARAQDAADAAALGAAVELRERLVSGSALVGDGPSTSDISAERAAAADYAQRNGARLLDYERRGLTIVVTVETVRAVGPAGWLGLGESYPRAVGAARLDPDYALPRPGSAGSMSSKAIADLEKRTGLSMRPDSALHTYGSDCRAGVDVAHLSDAMKVALVRLEHAMGRPVRLTSGYRDYACQAALYARVTGPVAPPGRSMHNYGQAVDVAEPGVVAAHARAAGLCQPLPFTDAVHFALVSSPECAGTRGVLAPGEAYAGDTNSFVTYDIRLVDAPEALP